MLFRSRLNVFALGLGLFAAVLNGCGGNNTPAATTPTTTTVTPNAVPTVTTLSPASATVGAAAQTLTVTGTNFLSFSTATYNGVAHTPTLVSATSMTLPLTASDQAAVGSFPVVVTNPTPGGGASNAVNFAVNNAAPTVTAIAPASLIAGAAATTLTITGTGFVAGSTVTFNGTAVTATIVSATSLTVAVPATSLTNAGSFAIVVTAPAPGGGSATSTFVVSNPAPTVTSIAPATLTAGSAATTLTITGTGFNSSSKVALGGTPVTAAVVNSTSITIPLTAANLATTGNFSIIVTNPTPGGGSSTAVNLVVSSYTVSGTVFKGTVNGAVVTAYPINADGTSGTAIGTATTDANGNFTLALTSAPAGAVRLTAVGGNYASVFDGTTQTSSSPVSALLDSVTANVSGVSITAASELVNSYTAGQLAAKTTTSEPTAHATARTLISGYIGLSGKTAVEALAPVYDKPSITSNPDGFTLGMFLGALAAEGKSVLPSDPDGLLAGLSADISDGSFDGKASGAAVTISGLTGPVIRMSSTVIDAATLTNLSPTAGTNDLLLALGSYITTGTKITSAGIAFTDVATLESTFFTGVTTCTCTPASSGLAASSAGAVSTYSLSGRQYLIVAARQQGVVIIDVTDPTLKTPPINAWPAISANTFKGADVGGVVAITGLTGHPQVLAYAYNSKVVSILNLNTLITGNPANFATTSNPVDVSANLTLMATSPASFSGGSAYIAGGIPDTGRLGIWLDTADGYGLIPLASFLGTPAPASVSLTLPFTLGASGQQVAENLGGDIADNQLFGGNYNGLQLLELGQNKSYFMSSTALQATAKSFNAYDLIDGNSVDSNLRVGIFTSEDTPAALFMNFKTAVETAGTGTALNTVAPAPGGLVQVVLGTTGGYYGAGPVLSGSAVDKNSHLALFMAGYSNDFAVGKLQDPASVAAGATWAGLSDWSYFTINSAKTAPLSSYSYATDPHAVGVVYNQTTGTPYGYLFDGSTDKGVVQIDLTNFLAMARAGATGDKLHQPLADPSSTSATVGTKTGLVLQEFTWTTTTGITPSVLKQTVTQEELQQQYPNQPLGTPIVQHP